MDRSDEKAAARLARGGGAWHEGAMLRLYYNPGSANLAPHMILEEVGAAFELVRVDQEGGEHKRPEYLRLNPTGRIPTLVDGELVVFETAAIILHLVDRFPDAGLAPDLRTPDRARFYQWMFHFSNTLQAEARTFFYPEELASGVEAVGALKRRSEARWGEMFALLDRHLVDNGPFMLGERYTALDPYLTMLVRWGRWMANPPRVLPGLRRCTDAVLARPAIARAFAAEGIASPYL
jgi:glutathione S-transferase